MNNATHSQHSVPESDPTLSTLIPHPSPRRAMILGLVGVFILLAAWASPFLLRPSAVNNASGGTWVALAPHHQVATVISLDPQGWPDVRLESVADVPGAEVTGAWVFTDDEYGLGEGLDPADSPSGFEFLRTALPFRDFDAGRVPQRLARGIEAQLVTLWTITDCSLLDGRPPQIELRSLVGTYTHEDLIDFASPGFDVLTLMETGICPTP